MIRFLRRLFSRPDPLEPNVDFVESLKAEAEAFAADKARRNEAIDQAMEVAHRHAVEDAAAFRKRMARVDRALPPLTAYSRKARKP
jgi:hypothetical protein